MKVLGLVRPLFGRGETEKSEQEVLDLVWKAIDGDATDSDLDRLDQLVASRQPARDALNEAMEMDKSLRSFFS